MSEEPVRGIRVFPIHIAERNMLSNCFGLCRKVTSCTTNKTIRMNMHRAGCCSRLQVEPHAIEKWRNECDNFLWLLH